MLSSVQGVITRQLKLKELGTLPRGSFERIARSTVLLVTDRFFDLLASGRIAVKRDTAIQQLIVEGGRRFALLMTGEKIPADIVICGTGWRQEVPFLDPALQARIMDDRALRSSTANRLFWRPCEAQHHIFQGVGSWERVDFA
jgi:hypothetical protein